MVILFFKKYKYLTSNCLRFKSLYLLFILTVSFNVSAIYAEEITPITIGYNVSGQLKPPYDTSKYNPLDFSLAISFYKLQSKENGFRFDHGLTSGFETNKYTGRVYIGSNWLLLGFMHDKIFYIPLLSGITTKAIIEISKYNKYILNAGGEIGVWINLGILGQFGLTERYMLSNNFSTRIEFGHRIPFLGSQRPKTD